MWIEELKKESTASGGEASLSERRIARYTYSEAAPTIGADPEGLLTAVGGVIIVGGVIVGGVAFWGWLWRKDGMSYWQDPRCPWFRHSLAGHCQKQIEDEPQYCNWTQEQRDAAWEECMKNQGVPEGYLDDPVTRHGRRKHTGSR